MRSDDDFSSRPTKRRRISHQSGSPSSSVFPTGPRSAQYYEDSDYLRFASLPTHQSSSPASQTVARMRQCSPEDIVDTSDNEERLFLHHSEIYRSDRSSPTTYHASSERSAQFSSPKFVVDSPQIEKSTEKLALSELPPPTSPFSSTPRLFPSCSLEDEFNPANITKKDTSATESDDNETIHIISQDSSNAQNACIRELKGASNQSPLDAPLAQPQISASTADTTGISENCSITLQSVNREGTNDVLPLLSQPGLVHSQSLASSYQQQAHVSSPSLTTPPPSPPRRRTREKNKKFAPYTAYRQIYGDATLSKLEEEEQIRKAHRPAWQNGVVQPDDDEDATFIGSQSATDESQQIQVEGILERATKAAHLREIAKSQRHLPVGKTQRPRPSVPVPTWPPIKPTSLSNRPNKSVVAEIAQRSKRFVTLDGSPIRDRSRLPSHPVQGSLSLANSMDELQRLYRDEIYEVNGSEEDEFNFLGPDHVDDREREVIPPTDPESGRSATEDMPEEMDSEEESQIPVRKRGLRRRFIVDDDDDEPFQGQDDTAENSQAESDEDVDRRKERILSKVWPTVLIKKNAELERRKELERQRRRRDEERARRRALGLGDSDISSEESVDDGFLAPGQSRTRKHHYASIPRSRDFDDNDGDRHLHPSSWRKQDLEGIIDLTSDRESLDNDVHFDIEDSSEASEDVKHHGYESSEGWMRYYGDDLSMVVEAIEDNRLHDGGRNRNDKSGTGNRDMKLRNIGWKGTGMKRLWQTRIDQMLNSTTKGSRSKRSNKRLELSRRIIRTKAPGRRGHQHQTLYRLPVNTDTITNSVGAFGPVQSQLPFEAAKQDSKQQYKRPQSKGHSSHNSHYRRKQRDLSPSSEMRLPKDTMGDLFDILTPTSTENKASTIRHSKLPRSKPSIWSNDSSVSHTPYSTTLFINPEDPDSNVEISLTSALAFGMRRTRKGYAVPDWSWLAKGRLLDLVDVICGTREPSDPLPCYFSTLQLDGSTSSTDLQLQFPTICDLLFEFVSQNPKPDHEQYHQAQDLMRYVCLYASASIRLEIEEVKDTVQFIKTQIVTLMDRVDEHLSLRGVTGLQYGHAALSIHWFAVEVTSRIAAVLGRLKNGIEGEMMTLNDSINNRFTISLMARLLEFGVRNAASVFMLPSVTQHTVQQYVLELWIALLHITMLGARTEPEKVNASTTFWRQMIRAFDQSRRQFASSVHETEFIFSTIFFLSSISSIDALGIGQDQRLLRAYWPIVCRALNNVDLSPAPNTDRKLSQRTLAAKDTYIGMLFARCNVLVFKWDWSLREDAKQLFDVLKGALKARRYMNLLHEQSDFPYFITQKDLSLLHVFEAKDSIQTIVIKLMLKMVNDAGEEKHSAKKWISLLAATSPLEFTRARSPTHKELSALFNQFTIKLVLLYVNPEANNARALINSSKKIVIFQNADQQSRRICIRAAMVFGRFCRHFCLPLDEVVKWMSEMGAALIQERGSWGANPSPQQVKEGDILCALLVASLRDVLMSEKLIDDGGNNNQATYPVFVVSMIEFLSKLLAATQGIDVSIPEVALLLKAIFDFRENFFPPPKLPQFPPLVMEEDSQEDYGFEPIDFNDPAFVEIMRNHEEPVQNNAQWNIDTKLAGALSNLNSPVASLMVRLGYAEEKERKKFNVEIWVECFVKLGVISTAHKLKTWDYFLQRAPSSTGRVGDIAWQQQTEPIFWAEVLKADPSVYQTHKEAVFKAWFMSLAADPAHQIPALTYVFLRIDGLKHRMFDGIPFPRTLSEEEFDDTYDTIRLGIVQGLLRNLDKYYQFHAEGLADESIVKISAETFDGMVVLLKTMRYNVGKLESSRPAVAGYIQYCADILSCIRSLSICHDVRLAPFLNEPWAVSLVA